jgi:hypothetical protein
MDIVITEIEDAGAGLKLLERESGCIELKLDISYNFFTAYQKNWFTIFFQKGEFREFQRCLKDGVKSWHGNSNIWQANKIFIKKQNHPNNYRNIRAYRRIFILGFHLIPATLSQAVVSAILEVNV